MSQQPDVVDVTTPTWLSRCQQPCGIPVRVDQAARLAGAGVVWLHDYPELEPGHIADPELRICIDATCPVCDHPEVGYSIDRELFCCSRCGHEQPTRPAP